MLNGFGSANTCLSEPEVQAILQAELNRTNLQGKRVVVLFPDASRSFPHRVLFRLLCVELSGRGASVDFLVALGTHRPMSPDELAALVGLTPEELAGQYPGVGIHNHEWGSPATFKQVGMLSAEEVEQLSGERLALDVPVRVNRMVLDCDLVIVCGPVFPHEVVGFSGGDKYFFPGIGGPEVINFTHWLGALNTCYRIIGTQKTPVRQVIRRATSFIPTPKLYCCAVVKGKDLVGLYASYGQEAWEAAANLSAQVHIHYEDRPYQRVLAEMPPMYEDLWTGAKGMYKLEPVVADGGELIIFAPHIKEVSYTHGEVLHQIGYHVRDYFTQQWEQFQGYPWGVLAHSTHVRGMGVYKDGVEKPRIRVTLATGISREVCRQLSLGYEDPANIQPQAWQDREAEGVLFVPHAGEILYRLKGGRDPWEQ